MTTFLIVYFSIQIAFFIVILIVSAFRDRRHEANTEDKVPEGYIKTSEISVDPTTGRKVTVYYNPSTGQRWYHSEKITK